MEPLRDALANANLSPASAEYFASLNDASFRSDVLRRIHWHCGQSQLEGVQSEFEQLLVPLGWDHAKIPPSEAARLAGPIIEHVLLTCASGGQRALCQADLLRLLESHTRISISRSDVDRLIESTGQADSFIGTQKLVRESELGLPSILAQRQEFKAQLKDMLLSSGVVFVSGGSGMGKTIAARLAARSTGREWSILDLRNLDTSAAAARLTESLSQLSTTLGGVIIDDLNQLDDPVVARAFAIFLNALRRRDQLCCATLYRRPSVRSLSELGVSSDVFVEAPALSQAEVDGMVTQAGGNDPRWGAAIYRRSDEGHPQLAQASIVGVQSRNWPDAELATLLQIGGASDDIRQEKASTRTRLVGSVPVASRALLYRLSLAIGKFDRQTALKLGQLEPKILNPGEALDRLVGPWIDEAGPDKYRVSPLVSGAGKEVLVEEDATAVHAAFADAIMSPAEVSAEQVSAAYVHGLVGKAEFALTKVANGIIVADADTRQGISKHLISLRLTTTSKPIFPSNMLISGMLRLAQLLVCLHTGTDDEIVKVWEALWREKSDTRLQGGEHRFEALIISKLLLSDRASVVSSWFDLLLRLDELTKLDEGVAATVREMETPRRLKSAPTVVGTLFMAQAMRLGSAQALVDLFERMDGLDPNLRRSLLIEYENVPSEFGLLVNSAWLAEDKAGTIDANAAAASFRRMSEFGQSWGYPALAAKAEIAVAIMQDEYGHDPAAAIHTLEKGAHNLGCNDLFTRAYAKVLYRQHDYEGSLAKIRGLPSDFAKNDHIERAYLCREAGVCAGHIGDWKGAKSWFAEGRLAALEVPSNQMLPAAIGLRADAAYAAYMADDKEAAFRELSSSLADLELLMPLSSLRATHCYKAIGHLVLWMNNQASHDFDDMIEGIEALPPGCCSNPDPHEGIEDLPQAPLDSLWYLLSDAETRTHVDVGIASALQARIGDNQIVAMEMRVRAGRVIAAVESHDDVAFCNSLRTWVDLRVYLKDRMSELMASNGEDPSRDTITPATPEQLAEESARDVSEEAVFAYLFVRIMSGAPDPLGAFYDRWNEQMTFEYPGSGLVQLVCDPSYDNDVRRLPHAKALGHLASGGRFGAQDLFIATLRFTEIGARSTSFRQQLEDLLDQWACIEWAQVIATQRFSLVAPVVSVPALELALSQHTGLARVAAILLAAAPAVGVGLSDEFRSFLAGLIA